MYHYVEEWYVKEQKLLVYYDTSKPFKKRVIRIDQFSDYFYLFFKDYFKNEKVHTALINL